MGVTEATKIKMSNGLGSTAKSAFFQIVDSGSLWGPLDDLKTKNAKAMTPIKFDFEGVSLIPWMPNFEIEKTYFFAIYVFPWIRPNFFVGKNSNSVKISLWRVNLSFQKYTFCKNWKKLVAQSWFGARIYSRALTLGCWPLNFSIKILKYTFSLVFVKKNLAQSDQGFKR